MATVPLVQARSSSGSPESVVRRALAGVSAPGRTIGFDRPILGIEERQRHPIAVRLEAGEEERSEVGREQRRGRVAELAATGVEVRGRRPGVGEGRLRRGAEGAGRAGQEKEAKAHAAALIGLEVGHPVVVGQPGEEERPVARDAAVGLLVAAEGVAADLPERRIGAGDGELVLVVGDADEALGRDVVAAGIGELLVIEADDGAAGFEVDIARKV